jgi:DNA mismatch repair protein MutS2
VPADVGGSDRILLRDARHPVLETTLAGRASSEAVVPISLAMEESDRVLIISGPNTGGKTVALKTIGLLAVMAHAGLPVPAREASFPAVSEVLVDIGDHQSIQASLSTFSSHVSNIASMIGRAGPGTLTLLDEVGTGTDPAEGAALAVAVLDRLRQDGSRVVATTHHGTVKVWGFTTEGVANAACEFDETSLRPTYRLLPGVAGSSSGLAIAERLGLPAEVVADAHRRLDPKEAEAEGYLARLGALAAEREEALRESVDERRRLERERRRVAEDAEQREKARQERFADELERVVATFDEESRRLLARVADVRERKAVERERRRQEARLRRAVRETMAEHGVLPDDGGPPEGWTPAPGDEVRVVSLGRTGRVQDMRGEEAEVLLGRSTFRLPRSDLRPAGETGKGRRLPPGVAASLGDREAVSRELSVIGRRVDEALAAVDKFLDDAALAGHESVRVIHGHGTGRLRNAVREMLDGHPHVDSFRPGGDDEGGDGATVVRLKE